MTQTSPIIRTVAHSQKPGAFDETGFQKPVRTRRSHHNETKGTKVHQESWCTFVPFATLQRYKLLVNEKLKTAADDCEWLRWKAEWKGLQSIALVENQGRVGVAEPGFERRY
jgi:hypothetical protein